MRHIMSDLVYQSLRNLKEASLLAREKIDKHHFDPKNYAKQFCTIKLATARGTGHTSAMYRYVLDYDKTLVLSLTHRMAGLIKDGFKSRNTDHKVHLSSINSIESCRGLDIQSIICDCSSLISEKKKELLYDTFSHECIRQDKFFFVFLG